MLMTMLHVILVLWLICPFAFIVYERLTVPGPAMGIWKPERPWQSLGIYILILSIFPLVLLEMYGKWKSGEIRISGPHRNMRMCLLDEIVGPEHHRPHIHRDTATENAFNFITEHASVLSADIQAILEDEAGDAQIDISEALNASISTVDGGGDNTTPGSLLNAICLGTVAGMSGRELIKHRLASSQSEVLYEMITRKVAAWEIGKENIGGRPWPWKGGTHLLCAPGTLVGKKTSVAAKLIVEAQQWHTPDKARFEFVAIAILASLRLAPSPRAKWTDRKTTLDRLGLGGSEYIIPDTAIDRIAERISHVTLFWPKYLEGKWITW